MNSNFNKKWDEQSQGGNQHENYFPDENMDGSGGYYPPWAQWGREEWDWDDKFRKDDNEQNDPSYNPALNKGDGTDLSN